jgi:hypothetical protein
MPSYSSVLSALLVATVVPSAAWAEPLLQLYLEGGTYDSETQTWRLTPAGSSSGEPFRIWAVGNVEQAKGHAIYDVKIAASYVAEADEGGMMNITLTPAIADGSGSYRGFDDPSAPDAPTFLQWNTDGATPLLGDGKNLPSHGVYGEGVHWQEFALGDFTLTDSPIGDFSRDFPEAGNKRGQINVYDVTVSGFSVHPVEIHFDLYDHTYSGTKIKSKFAPFSHSADVNAEVNVAPQPSAFALALTALATFFAWNGWRGRFSDVFLREASA